MSNICVVGAGYVGLVTAACFAEMGHRVTCVEIDQGKLETLGRGELPVHEPGLPELWHRHALLGRLSVTGDYQQGLKDADFVFITVGTPSAADGKPDLTWVRLAAKSIAQWAGSPFTVVIKSTVPVGTADEVAAIMSRDRDGGFPVVTNPEFLREGLAVYDFFHPTRVVVGSRSKEAAQAVAELYKGLGSPIILCDSGTAEMSKYASNVFLALRISFINEIAYLCDRYGLDVKDVARVAGKEPRCGDGYLGAGLGFGGSCLPKDLKALISMAEKKGVFSPLMNAIWQINTRQPSVVISKLQDRLGRLRGKTIGLLGLSFKPDSDDMREASSLSIVSLLLAQGCTIKAYDPVAMKVATKLMPKVKMCTDAYEVAEGSDGLILVTEWDDFKALDKRKLSSSMNTPVLIDGRNCFDPEEMAAAGFTYECIGRRGAGQKRPQPQLALSGVSSSEQRKFSAQDVVSQGVEALSE